MVGVLTDKQGITPTTEGQAAPAPASRPGQGNGGPARPRTPTRAAARKLAVELTDEQLDSLRDQVNALGPERPTEIVLYANGRRVGELSVGRVRLYA
jgi:hypothetical protein